MFARVHSRRVTSVVGINTVMSYLDLGADLQKQVHLWSDWRVASVTGGVWFC